MTLRLEEARIPWSGNASRPVDETSPFFQRGRGEGGLKKGKVSLTRLIPIPAAFFAKTAP